jgi:tetratricopeptide (TPR) repeat protein
VDADIRPGQREGRAHRLANPALGLATLLVSLAVAEIVLRVAVDAGGTQAAEDPFSGFVGTPHAFALVAGGQEGGRYVPRPGKVDPSQSFSAHKADGVFRIFVLGGSTTFGQPYGPEGSFARWLGDDLRALYPDRDFEVINAGVPGFGSMRVLQILKETAAYEPDVFLVYTGQNEFRDARFHYWDITRPQWLARTISVLQHSRMVSLLLRARSSLIANILGQRQTSYGGEIIAGVLEEPFSERTFRSDSYYTVPTPVLAAPLPIAEAPHRPSLLRQAVKRLLRAGWMEMPRDEVLRRLGDNVEEMAAVAAEQGVPLLLLLPAQNPKERDVRSPAVIVVRTEPGESDWAARWESTYAMGLEQLENDGAAVALSTFDHALSILGREPDPLTRLYRGLAFESLGAYDAARGEYEQRLQEDHVEVVQTLREVALANAIPLLDVPELLRTSAEAGIVGYENYFVDGVHMTVDAYHLIGRAAAETIIDNQWVGGGRTAIDRSPLFESPPTFDSAELNATLGWAEFNQGHLDEARERAGRALGGGEDIPLEIRIQAYLLMGYVWTAMGRLDLAKEAWDRLETLYRRFGE